MDEMRWYVGIHLAPSCVGALRFARWLHASAGERYRIHGVYCVSTLHAADPGAVGAGPEVSEFREAITRFVERLQCEGAFATMEAFAGDADAVLRRLVAERGGEAIVVGRSSGRDSNALIALGAIPRRVARRATVPVVVVPPDLSDAQLGGGPVVAAVTPHEDSEEALRFARAFARTHGLELRIVHVLPWASTTAMHEPGEDRGEMLAEDTAHVTRATLEQWCARLDVLDPILDIIGGRVGKAVIDYARSKNASLIVCGSRRLSLVERLVSASHGSSIAAHADCSVAVVPPR